MVTRLLWNIASGGCVGSNAEFDQNLSASSLLRRLPKAGGDILAEVASPTSKSPLDNLWEVREMVQKVLFQTSLS
jgi:hypothetical protein